MTRPYFLVYGSDLFANEKRMELGLLDRGALTTLWVYGSVKGDEAHWSTLKDVVLLLEAQRFVDAESIAVRLVEKGWLDVGDGVRIHDWGAWQPPAPKTASQRQREWRERSLNYNKADIFARDGNRCRYCERPVTDQTGVLEHAIPSDRPGSHDPANIVTACRSCNMKKGSRTPEEAGMPLLPTPAEILARLRETAGVPGSPVESIG